MHKLYSYRWFLVALFFLPSLYANEQTAPTKLDTVKSYLMPVKQFAEDNEKTLKNSAKAIGAILLLKGLYNVMWDQVTILPNPDSDSYKSAYAVANAICFPKYRYGEPLSCPPYLTALAISAYLLESRIYEKLGTWVKEHFALNDHTLNILKNSAKIGGALLLLKGHYHLAHDQLTIINPKYKPKSGSVDPLKYIARPIREILSPHLPEIFYRSEDEKIPHLSRAPYISTFGISAYLIGTGSYGIYQEICDIIKDIKEGSKKRS